MNNKLLIALSVIPFIMAACGSVEDQSSDVKATTTVKICIQTTDGDDAGTDANVTLALYVDGRYEYFKNLDAAGDNFERGDRDCFNKTMPSFRNLTRIALKRDDSGTAPDWLVDWVKVTANGTTETFSINNWIGTSWTYRDRD